MGAIMIKAIAFTLYPVRDMKRAWDFHEETLGLRLASREVRDFEWVEYDLEGDTFAFTNFANAGIPGAATCRGIACEMQHLDKAGRWLRAKRERVRLAPLSSLVHLPAEILDSRDSAPPLRYAMEP